MFQNLFRLWYALTTTFCKNLSISLINHIVIILLWFKCSCEPSISTNRRNKTCGFTQIKQISPTKNGCLRANKTQHRKRATAQPGVVSNPMHGSPKIAKTTKRAIYFFVPFSIFLCTQNLWKAIFFIIFTNNYLFAWFVVNAVSIFLVYNYHGGLFASNVIIFSSYMSILKHV